MRCWTILVLTILLLPFAGLPRDLSTVINALIHDKSAKVRAQSALTLGSLCSKDAEEALKTALSDENSGVRASAARSLGSCKSISAFKMICELGKDQDQLVSKWARWSAFRIIAFAPMVTFGIKGLVSNTPFRQDEFSKYFQEAVLETLLAQGRFDVSNVMSFGEEDALRTEESIHIEFRGEILQVLGDSHNANADAHMKVECQNGFVLWEGMANAEANLHEVEDEENDPIVDKNDAQRQAVFLSGKRLASTFVSALGKIRNELDNRNIRGVK